MRYGTIVQFFPEKGFGFIQPDSGPDVFFHVTALGACRESPDIRPGQAVKYELQPGTEPKYGARARRNTERSAGSEPRARPQAQLVELIDKIPGAHLDDASRPKSTRHPRARQKKPSWRR